MQLSSRHCFSGLVFSPEAYKSFGYPWALCCSSSEVRLQKPLCGLMDACGGCRSCKLFFANVFQDLLVMESC